MITSINNQQIKNVIQLQTKSKARKEQNCFITEGYRIYLEIPETQLVKTFVSESFFRTADESVRQKLKQYEIVEDNVFKQISNTVTPQGILSIVRKAEITVTQLNSMNGKTYLILEDLQDPGNLGTIIRTAEGAGVSAVIMSKNTVDVYNPKVVRSTMGSIFRVPFLYVEDIYATVTSMQQKGIKVYAAHLKGTCNYDQPDYTNPSAFLIGNEGNGLSETITGLSDQLIKIPMLGKVESLNAASAATILMYEALRQNLLLTNQ